MSVHRVHEIARLSGASGLVDVADKVSARAFARALGEELRRVRESLGWSRTQLVERLPSRIGERTLLSYEHGTRQLYASRFVELCQVMGVAAPVVLARALRRARLFLDTLPLRVDLRALLGDASRVGTFRPLEQWARNALNVQSSGVVEVEPAVVRNLALFMGCSHQELAKYLVRFVCEDAEEVSADSD